MATAPVPRIKAPVLSLPKQPLKSFAVAPWIGNGEGDKIIIFGNSGMGKTTLAAMAPTPVFVGIDDGGRKIKHPKTGKVLDHVPGIETFGDVRAALQSNVFDNYASVVLDTVTMLQHWALPYMFATIPHEKGGVVKSIEGWGWGKGYRHLFDVMHLILADCDRLVRMGKNIILIAQEAAMTETNTSGENYLKAGPDLHHSDKQSVRKDYIAWADHVFRITWANTKVEDRKINPVSGRVINVKPDATFEAKSRGSALADCEAVSFERPDDDSLWSLLFNQ